MNTLFEVEGKLKNGDTVRAGSVVMVEYGPYYSILRVFDDGDRLAVKHFMYGNVSLSHLQNQGGNISIISPKDAYLFCKKNQWETSEILKLFKGG